MKAPKVRGRRRAAICIILAVTMMWLWFHSSFHFGDNSLSNCNSLIMRKWGIAIASWRGRIAFGSMDNPKYKYWNYGYTINHGHFISFLGGFLEYQAADDGSANWDWDFDCWNMASNRHGTAWRFAGFAFASHTVSHDRDDGSSVTPIAVRTECFAIPDYLIVALLMIYPAIWIRRRRNASRQAIMGHCAACSYDLRAHRPGDKCPECGALVPPPRR
jgi:hypothetical protein